MRDLIQGRRGTKDTMPLLAEGEYGLTIDEERVYVGGLNGNIGIAMQDELELLDANSTLRIGTDIRKHGAIAGEMDSSAKIQMVIDDVYNSGGGKIIIPLGLFFKVHALNLRSGVIIEGSGYNSGLINNLANTKTLTNLNQTALVDKMIKVSNFRIINFGGGGDNDTCIDLWYISDLLIENMYLENTTGHGVYIRGCSNVRINNIYCKSIGEQGIAVTSGDTIVIEHIRGEGNMLNLVDIEPNAGDVITNIILDDIRLISGNGSALDISSDDYLIKNISVSRVYIDPITIKGIDGGNLEDIFVTSSVVADSFVLFMCRNVQLSRLHVIGDNIGTIKFKLSACTGIHVSGLMLVGPSGTTVDAMYLLDVHDVKIKNVHITAGGRYGIWLRNSSDLTVDGIDIDSATYGIMFDPSASNVNIKIKDITVTNATTGVRLQYNNDDVYIDGDLSGSVTPISIASSNVGKLSIGNLGGIRKVMYGVTIPIVGTYLRNDYVINLNKSILGTAGSKYIVRGWERVVSGSNHVLNTDWVEDRALTGT